MTQPTHATSPTSATHAASPTSPTYDYIIVGAGSAGCALAARLSEDPATSVLLLEAGPRDTKQEIHIPAAFSKLFRSDLDWSYDTQPQPNLGNRTIYWPRGKVLGGSSSINAMMWVRGFAEDYDSWVADAGEGWSWKSLLPYFLKVERVERVEQVERVESPHGAPATDDETGRTGTMSVEAQRSPRSSTAVYLQAAREIGLTVNPANTRDHVGVSQTMVSQRRGARFSAADGYLKPARTRRNLTVQTGSHTTRVLFEGRQATGVEYVRNKKTETAHATKEVILSGGAINTPQLLMLSGIGARDELERHGISVLVDSPEVGKNLKDHLVSALIIDTDKDTLFAAERLREVAGYLTRRSGMLTSNVAEAYGFIKSDPSLEQPDMELIFAPVAFVDEGLTTHPSHGLTIGNILLQPHSSGTITLASADPFAKPLIDPRYLSDPEGKDRAAVRVAMGVCEDLIATEAMGTISKRTFIKPDDSDRMSRAERDELSITHYSHTLYHPVGTARMGLDPHSVVDEQLRVRGVSGLRVADASVMPNIIHGHTNAISIVIGEKAADLIAGP